MTKLKSNFISELDYLILFWNLIWSGSEFIGIEYVAKSNLKY